MKKTEIDSIYSLIQKGESNSLEFKSELQEDSKKWIKTIIAFANTNGGILIIGVDDNKNISGVKTDSVFSLMDSIVDSITNNCEPMIVPDISIQNLQDKTIIIVSIPKGMQKPY
ncbi:AlbA family DNA-binding domain-containing protein, partial [Treponema sp.]|uniref:AlbA family DNA-binding domain-containing protein n=1 Tax=Treponema sp. TaxID=166 RepID=UPI003FD8BF95